MITEQLHDLVDDDEFWRFQAHSLAVFATPENLLTFRLPNALTRIPSSQLPALPSEKWKGPPGKAKHCGPAPIPVWFAENSSIDSFLHVFCRINVSTECPFTLFSVFTFNIVILIPQKVVVATQIFMLALPITSVVRSARAQPRTRKRALA